MSFANSKRSCDLVVGRRKSRSSTNRESSPPVNGSIFFLTKILIGRKLGCWLHTINTSQRSEVRNQRSAKRKRKLDRHRRWELLLQSVRWPEEKSSSWPTTQQSKLDRGGLRRLRKFCAPRRSPCARACRSSTWSIQPA